MKAIYQTMTYAEIYNIAVKLVENFAEVNNIYLSAAVVFSIQKNKQILLEIASEIEASRKEVLNKYKFNENLEVIQIAPEKIEMVNKELQQLLSIEEEVKIYTFSIDELEDAKFTPLQMEAILFMIKD